MRADPYEFRWRYYEQLTGQKEQEVHADEFPNGMSFEEAVGYLKFFRVFWAFGHSVTYDDNRYVMSVRDDNGILAAEAWIEEVER